jgi:hypothetical protein
MGARFVLFEQFQERGGSGVSVIRRPNRVLDGRDAVFLGQFRNEFLHEQELVTTRKGPHGRPQLG